MHKPGKGDALIRFIEAKIICGRYAPGTKLPSLRQLMEKFGLSMNTARRGVAELERRGMVEFRHGSGTFVAEKRRPPTPCRIGVVFALRGVNYMDSYTGIALNGVRDAARVRDIRLTESVLSASEMNDAVFESLAAREDAMLLLGGYDAVLRHPHAKCPAVGVSMHCAFDGMFSLVELDPIPATELALEFFLRRRRDRLILVRHERPVHRFRETLFRAAWEAAGGKIETTVTARLDNFPEDVGILYFCGVDALADAKRCRLESGHELTDNKRDVLCIDGKPLFLRTPGPALPTVTINWHSAGEAALEECLRRIRHPGSAARRIYLAPGLHVPEPQGKHRTRTTETAVTLKKL